MKTAKNRVLAGLFILMAVLPMLMTSCSKESDDLRDEVTGQYSYTVKIYEKNGNDLIYIGDQEDHYDIVGTMNVEKNSDDPNGLNFYDGSDLMFQAEHVMDAGNAIVFDVPDQEAYIGPTRVLISGYHYWDVQNSSYHGAFLYADESIEAAFTMSIMNVDTGLVMVLTAFRE